MQNTEDQFMKELHILVDIMAKNFLNKEISHNTEEQFMKESNILAYNVAIDLLYRVTFKNI